MLLTFLQFSLARVAGRLLKPPWWSVADAHPFSRLGSYATWHCREDRYRDASRRNTKNIGVVPYGRCLRWRCQAAVAHHASVAGGNISLCAGYRSAKLRRRRLSIRRRDGREGRAWKTGRAWHVTRRRTNVCGGMARENAGARQRTRWRHSRYGAASSRVGRRAHRTSHCLIAQYQRNVRKTPATARLRNSATKRCFRGRLGAYCLLVRSPQGDNSVYTTEKHGDILSRHHAHSKAGCEEEGIVLFWRAIARGRHRSLLLRHNRSWHCFRSPAPYLRGAFA